MKVHVPDFQNDPIFVGLLSHNPNLQPDNIALQTEYAANKWLEVNRQDYRDVVARVMQDLKNEIMNNREAILASTQSH